MTEANPGITSAHSGSTSEAGPLKPDTGSTPKVTLKIRTRITPSQNPGTDQSMVDTQTTTRSNKLPRFIGRQQPNGHANQILEQQRQSAQQKRVGQPALNQRPGILAGYDGLGRNPRAAHG